MKKLLQIALPTALLTSLVWICCLRYPFSILKEVKLVDILIFLVFCVGIILMLAFVSAIMFGIALFIEWLYGPDKKDE